MRDIIREILSVSKDILALEFDTEEEKKKYLREHKVNPKTKLVVKKKEKKTPKKKDDKKTKVVQKIKEKVKGKSKLSPKLYAKVKKEKGKGRQIKLSKDETVEVLTKGIVGFISAGINPNDEKDKKLTGDQVSERYGKLKKDLENTGFKFVKVHGKYGEEEDSFMVMVNEVNRSELSDLGSKYNQDSVIYSEGNKNEMIFTTGENKGKKYKGDGFKELGSEVEDFYSEIDTGSKKMRFSLNFDFGKLVAKMKKIANSVYQYYTGQRL
jgi:hypothetical protein